DYMLDAYEEDVAMPQAPEEWDESEGSDEESESEEDEEDGDRHDPIPDRVKTSRLAEESDETDSEDYESESEDESDEESDDEASAAGPGSRSGQAENSMLSVGYKNDRSFVVRGTKIGVFKHTDGDQMLFDTTINSIDDTHGRKFIPKTAMLSEQDSAMVLMDQQRPNELYRMDLERGKVVEEWKVHEDIPTVAIAHNTKYGQMTNDKTLVGLSHNLIYRIDPRIGGDNLVVEGEMQAYTTKSHFTAAATTESGAVVVGSEKGEIRMFDRVGVRAKTVLPALGEPIIGIDVTSDGRYIVATCKNYLLLIDTRIPDDPEGRTGFEISFPKQKKPAPKRLQLKPEHVVYMGGPVRFTPARFNQSPEGNNIEDSIVTSTGPFVITWNLRRVLGTGRGDAYHIKQYSDRVVADNFRFGQDNAIVVTLPNDVQTVKRSQLAKPTRKSLMVPRPVAKRLASPRHDIVDSPY
ncbi:Vacuolar import and degradation protein 27, partial [Linderina pennispora]